MYLYKKTVIFCVLTIFIFINNLFTINTVMAETGPDIDGDGIILMDFERGQILYEENKNKKLYPASTTKILTTYLLLNNSSLFEKVKISENAHGVRGSSLYLNQGNKISARDLVYGIILVSANDGAVAAAEHVAGSKEEFVDMMNEKAAEFGAINTNFENPHGLSKGYPEHKTTAYDLAMITREVLKCPLFKKIITTEELTLTRPDGERIMHNSNRLLYNYPGAKGVKTGYTSKSKNTIVAAAKREDTTLIAVILGSGSRNQLFKDTEKLLDYGFESYEKVKLLEKEEHVKTLENLIQDREVDVFASSGVIYLMSEDFSPKDITRTIKIKESLSLPLEKEEIVGYVKFYEGGKKVGATDLVTNKEISAAGVMAKATGATTCIMIIGIAVITGVYVFLIKFKNK